MPSPASDVELHVGLVADLVGRAHEDHLAIARVLVGLATVDEAIENFGCAAVVHGIALRGLQLVTQALRTPCELLLQMLVHLAGQTVIGGLDLCLGAPALLANRAESSRVTLLDYKAIM